MAKKEFSYDIKEVIGIIKESDSHDWCKVIARIQWGDNPTSIDIRNLNMNHNKVGKGISLSNEEVERLIEILLENDYADIQTLRKAIEKKVNRFNLEVDKEVDFNINF
jgi:hypothetical protein